MRARAVFTPGRDPRANLSLEEAIFLGNEGVTVRFWTNDESVIIGRAQLARYETDVDYCSENSIPIVRRFTAGGAVYNGPGNINWSIFLARGVRAGALRHTRDPAQIFAVFSQPLVRTLREMGVDARLDPPNRIVTPEGKVSGMAAYVSKDGLLCHGTLLLDADLGRVKMLTSPARDSIERRYTRSRDVRTVNTGIGSESFVRNFVRVFEEETGLVVDWGQPSEAEDSAAKGLLHKYGDSAWNLGDPFEVALAGGSHG